MSRQGFGLPRFTEIDLADLLGAVFDDFEPMPAGDVHHRIHVHRQARRYAPP